MESLKEMAACWQSALYLTGSQIYDKTWPRLVAYRANPGHFSDQISLHFGSTVYFGSSSKNVEKSDLTSPGLVPCGVNLTLCWSKSDIPASQAKMYWNLIWKSPRFVPLGANLAHFVAKSVIRAPPTCEAVKSGGSWPNTHRKLNILHRTTR